MSNDSGPFKAQRPEHQRLEYRKNAAAAAMNANPTAHLRRHVSVTRISLILAALFANGYLEPDFV